MKSILKNTISSNKKYTSNGKVASYIPELKKANQDDLGICIMIKIIICTVLVIIIKNSPYKVFLNL